MYTKKLFVAVVCLLQFVALYAQEQRIMINQQGYYTNAPKIAIVTGTTTNTDFFVVLPDTKDIVYKGTLSEEKQSANSSTVTRIADFSTFKRNGTYIIAVPKVGYSYTFTIGANEEHNIAVASLKAFYYQRMSMPIEVKYAGKWARAEGHPDSNVYVHASAATDKRPEGFTLSSPGGWYDAGDYNKYIVNSGITMGTLLSAYEDYSNYFDTLHTNIPESNDAVPDILNEVLYNLRWMLTMQDPNDGGVYHKCTNASFDKMIMPVDATNKRYVVAKGTAATLDFAAVMAQASRIFNQYKKQLPGLGDSCLKAATYAWQWAMQHPDVAYNQNELNKQFEPKINTGAYGDNHFDDEWFWAASELFITTKSKTYYSTLVAKKPPQFGLPSWSNVAALGYYSMIRSEDKTGQDKNFIQLMKQDIVRYAENYIQNLPAVAFATVIGENKNDFIWGSNAVAANESIVLLNAYKITGDKKYMDAALTNLDYILGRNATGYCFVTGFGTKSTMHPHHRLSIADGVEEPIPGLLAGGPNPGRQDGCNYAFTEPETAYTDDDCAYASNEIAINWNAPLVYITNAFEALQHKVQYSDK